MKWSQGLQVELSNFLVGDFVSNYFIQIAEDATIFDDREDADLGGNQEQTCKNILQTWLNFGQNNCNADNWFNLIYPL